MNSTNDLPDELEALIQIHLWRHWPDELAKGHRVAVLKVGNELRGRLACYMN